MSTHLVCGNWRKRADPVAPSALHFTAIVAPHEGECTGCLFETQRSAVCDQAAVAAEAADLPACSPRTGPTFIYVLDRVTDPRQTRIKNTTEEK